MTSEEEDCQDMDQLVQGEDDALDRLMNRHAEKLFHYLIRIVRNEGDAEDIAQESFVRVYRHRDRFRPKLKFSTWLYAIATNLARDHLRWRSRRPQVSLNSPVNETSSEMMDVIPSSSSTPGEMLEANERSAIIRHAIAALPEENRIPLILAEFEDRSQADIASILGCSVKAVEMRLYRARKELGKLLRRFLTA
ncbi:MAG: sigma-70 family RNA polymerase sigma factor [Verrucomicrobia bacterium]|nr:sigma-70 family RNA polymerase sigma factor [Verrucomicrobiota bacterium]